MANYERLSVAVPPDQAKKFYKELERIKKELGASSNNEAIIKLIFMFIRLNFESEQYKHFLKDALAYEALWEKKEGVGIDFEYL